MVLETKVVGSLALEMVSSEMDVGRPETPPQGLKKHYHLLECLPLTDLSNLPSINSNDFQTILDSSI